MGILNYAPALINALMGGSQANAAPAPQSTPATSPPTQVVPTDDYTTVVRPDVVARKGAAWVGDKKTTKQMVIDDYNFNKNSTAKPASTDSSTDSSADVGLPEENHSFEASPETTTATHPWFQNGSPFSFVGGGINKLTSAVGGDRKIVTSLDANGKPLGTDTNGKPMTLPSYDDNGNQKTLAATEDPNSLLGILKGGIPAIIGNMAPVNMASKLLGLGSTAQNDRPSGSNGDLFKGSNQTIDPQVKADIQQKYDQMTSDAQMAATSPIDYLIKKAEASKNAYDMAIAGAGNPGVGLEGARQIGIGTPAESQAFKTEAQHHGALVSAYNGFETAIKHKNPQAMASSLNELVKQGNLSDQINRIQGGAEMMSAAQHMGPEWLDWIGKPENVAVLSKIRGVLSGAYQNAQVEAGNSRRQGYILPDRDQLGNSKVAEQFDPYYNAKNNGLPEEDTVNKDLDNLAKYTIDAKTGKVIEPFEAQGLRQQVDVSGKSLQARKGTIIGTAEGLVTSPAKNRGADIRAAYDSLTPEEQQVFHQQNPNDYNAMGKKDGGGNSGWTAQDEQRLANFTKLGNTDKVNELKAKKQKAGK